MEQGRQYSFFAFLSRMKHIYRWSLMRNVNQENIQEHSLQVAIIAHALALIKNLYYGGNVNPERVALLAMYHDCNETITGDLPTPIKYYNPEISRAYRDLERVSREKLLSMLPEELADLYKPILFYDEESEEGKLVKAADRLCAYIKCIEEIKAGNGEFAKAKQAVHKRLMEMDSPELKHFMDHYIENFSLTLDELN
ncbi:MAG TPA: 5'-deoxynucleotidase [Thermoclostridium caenicola]|uniref:5'-deoxynucleotidase n=1 Tax=Thermoclostridium caenicola TaxID=659425 RepID=A0A1M6IA31_9FIRM|nr:5'-deoxynucleotidase [Thermoclostridium caenicola]SHJ31313.1 5'-deoxynucleotidase [Thermoclostridium caenicola]HOK43737.1 5'-deoxynucleotidase [Thermoclostridium caenicola]HOL84723.1 5'-deoxynucleotidase [Thermoclostridium caenicola]HOP72354.1 5'-deoxynucleotidase [Thermoclostridium caenicola]HPO75876.1 5'-deoxynucleotidase [Thermoclostridium caenicola]